LAADGKTVADMGGVLDLIGQGEGEILKGNPAFSVPRDHELIGPEPELAGPLAYSEQPTAMEGSNSARFAGVTRQETPRPSRLPPCMPRGNPGQSPSQR
jgi:hypothetical protein